MHSSLVHCTVCTFPSEHFSSCCLIVGDVICLWSEAPAEGDKDCSGRCKLSQDRLMTLGYLPNKSLVSNLKVVEANSGQRMV